MLHLRLKALLLLTATLSKTTFSSPLALELNVRSQILSRTPLPLGNARDMIYTTEITLGGSDQVYTVALDTGSHEFWVTPLDKKMVPNSKDTGKTAEISYVDSSVEGPIKTADLSFAGHNIPDQAFVEIPASQAMKDIQGVIGLRIDQPSSIAAAWKNTAAAYSPLQRIFTQQKTAVPRIVTMLLGRSVDPTDSTPGVFTIGSVLKEYTEIKDEPKLRTTPGAHFKFLMDDYSMRVEENLISADTALKPASMADIRKLTAFVDSGFSFNQVPESVAEDIYLTYPNAEKTNIDDIGEVWILPCTEEVRMVFRFGEDSDEIPIHPLDVTFEPSQLKKDEIVKDGQKMCIGTFQPIVFETEETDIILGAPFLRNVYALTNFGEDVTENPKDGYMQFLGRTDSEKASEDFRKVRCGGQACK